MSAGSPDASRSVDVVLVADLADELLDEVLEGDDAVGAAVLVDDHGEVRALLAHGGDATGSTGLVPGSISTGRQASLTQPVRRRRRMAEQVAHVQEAQHVVEALAGHRVAGVGQVADLRRGLGQGERRRR